MVIAPLLGPNVALALATTLADGPLARRALKALGAGIAIALSISVAWGLAVHVDSGMPGMMERIQVGPGDIVWRWLGVAGRALGDRGSFRALG
jgi:hypothetical protein